MSIVKAAPPEYHHHFPRASIQSSTIISKHQNLSDVGTRLDWCKVQRNPKRKQGGKLKLVAHRKRRCGLMVEKLHWYVGKAALSPLPGCNRPHQEYYIFRLRDPELNLHLPLIITVKEDNPIRYAKFLPVDFCCWTSLTRCRAAEKFREVQLVGRWAVKSSRNLGFLNPFLTSAQQNPTNS